MRKLWILLVVLCAGCSPLTTSPSNGSDPPEDREQPPPGRRPIMSTRIYGTGTHTAFRPADAAFTTVGQNDGWITGGAGIVESVQSDIYLITVTGIGTYYLLLEIPDTIVPSSATSITVTMGLASEEIGGIVSGTFAVKTGGTIADFGSWGGLGGVGLVESTSSARTTDANAATLTGLTFRNSLWGFKAVIPSGIETVDVNKFALKVVYTDPTVTGLTSTQIIGTTARLGVARLGCTRLGAIPDVDALGTGGIYRWKRNTSNSAKAVPPSASSGTWTKTRPPG